MVDQMHLLAPLRFEAAAVRRGASTAGVVHTGMGARRAARAARAMVAQGGSAPRALLGVAGALTGELQPGDVIVADAVHSTDGARSFALPGAHLIAADLAARGIPVRVGPIVSADRIVTHRRRRELASSGALAVDMEAAALLGALRDGDDDQPVAVVRVVLDTARHELSSWHTVRNLPLVWRRLGAVVPTLERWARAAGPRTVVLAGPRSFCAGVERAIEIVERAIERYDGPIYVRRQIVHNSHVVADLEGRGAVFVHELEEVPEGATVVLAAHGVTPNVRDDAARRRLRVIDATCPLVGKVHAEARRFAERGLDIVLIGHADHEEVEGTVGEAPGHITVVGTADEVDSVEVRDPERIAFLTQTTLAVDEVAGIVDRLRTRFPALSGPRSEDICYASQNRQEAVTAIAAESDIVLVVGSPNSSNSRRLTEVAERAGTRSYLVDDPRDVALGWLEGATTIGITAGASAPESKVQELVAALGSLGAVRVEERAVHHEMVSFSLPVEVR